MYPPRRRRPETAAEAEAIAEFIRLNGLKRLSSMDRENPRICGHCGRRLGVNQFSRDIDKYCRLCWSYRRRYRILEVGAVSALGIHDRDGWICQLCQKPIDLTFEWPQPLSATLDYVVPPSQGGKHVSSNLRAAHLVCSHRAQGDLGDLLVG